LTFCPADQRTTVHSEGRGVGAGGGLGGKVGNGRGVSVGVGVDGCGVRVGVGDPVAVAVAVGDRDGVARGGCVGRGVGGGTSGGGSRRHTTAIVITASMARNATRRTVGRWRCPGSRRADVTRNPRIPGVVITHKGTRTTSVDAVRHEG